MKIIHENMYDTFYPGRHHSNESAGGNYMSLLTVTVRRVRFADVDDHGLGLDFFDIFFRFLRSETLSSL